MLSRLRIPVLGAITFAMATSLAAAEAPMLSVELSLEPAGQAGTYLASVLVSDAASGEVLSAPRLTFRAGQPAQTSSRTPSGELVELEVAVSSDGSEASFEARLVRDGKPLTFQKGKVRLTAHPPESHDLDPGSD